MYFDHNNPTLTPPPTFSMPNKSPSQLLAFSLFLLTP